MTLLMLLLLLLMIGLLARKLYDRFWGRGLSCRVEFCQEYAVEDETAALTEVVVNDKLLPMPVVEINFHMDKRLRFGDGQNASVSDQSYRRDVFALSVRQQITRTLEFRCAGRGYFRIDEAGVTAQDLFLTRKYLDSRPQSAEFYVLPRPVPPEKLAVPFAQVMGAVLSRQKVYDDPFEFAGLREYARGDPMKYINWKASARAGGLLTNLHDSTLSQKVTVLLDMEGKGVQQADFLNEAAVRAACSLCERLLLAGLRLDVYSNGRDAQDGGPWKAAGVSGRGSVLFLRRRFACVEAENGLPPVTEYLPRAQGVGGERDLTVLVTRNQREDAIEEFSQALGKGRGVALLPYREEHRELSGWSNVTAVWMEV